MAEEVRIWQVDKADALTEIKRSRLGREERIERWISSDISLLSPDLLIIGEQVETASGGRIDLLCINRSGNLVIVELKRDKTPRDVTAQALDYASWVKDLDAESIGTIAAEYLKGETLEAAFQSKFGSELPEVINEHHAMVVVASEIDDSTERIIRYLSETHGVDINAVRFQFFQAQDGREFLVRTFTVAPQVVEQNTKRGGSKRTVTNETDFFASLDDNGKVIFKQILEFARANGMPLHWGAKGFSLNVDLRGTHVAILYGYPPHSAFKQSVYTALVGQGGLKMKTRIPEDEFRTLRSKAEATGLFRPAGRELWCPIDRTFSDTDFGKLLGWCEEVAGAVAKYGLKEQVSIPASESG